MPFFKYFTSLFSLLTLVACQVDNPIPTGEPTPLTLDIPSILGNSYSIPTDNPLTEEGVLLGRHLFFDPRLSRDSSISCASCHDPALAFTDGKDFSIGVDNQVVDRSSMSIVNMIFRKDFFWDGRAATLEEQALGPIENPKEMDLAISDLLPRLRREPIYVDLFENAFGDTAITTDRLAKSIAQFERTITSGNSRYDNYKLGTEEATDSEIRGELLFYTHPSAADGLRGGNCGDCHSGTHMMDNSFHNNGLDSIPTDLGRELVTEEAVDRGKFITPTLRNIAITAPYMHDGRFSTLEELMDHYNTEAHLNPLADPLMQNTSNTLGGTSLDLTEQEKTDIINFLKMLTDSSLVENESFQNPW